MSVAAEELIKEVAEVHEIRAFAGAALGSKPQPIFNRVLDFLSSVRFGIALLILLVVLSMLGMLIIQQNVNGFDAYFASLTPAEKYLFGALGFFDIYHSWYFNFLLLVLSLNIILASIDRFPLTWRTFISRPKLDASRHWLLGQKLNARLPISGATEEEVVGKIRHQFKKNGLKPRVTEKKGKLCFR